ncbi:MAG TPA: RNA polymerase sigma factor [Candidatus Eisenbacteria bacterium]|jgi:RNA polymerase sigma-70 factor (ECF subfamily)|nr:RNA polymerase sigma factor [Candidatus Eisenbacteria bacterium]
MQGVSLVYLEAGEEIERISAAQSGDRQAYLALVRQYARPLYRIAYAMCGDADAADLLARDALICGWGELREIPDSLRFFPWILGIMRRIHETPSAVASSPKATETRPLTAIDAHGADLSPTNREPQTPAEPAEGSPGDARLRARTLASFAELRPDQRMTLSLRILEELPYEQLAALLDLSLGVATLRLSQARGHILSRTTGLGGDA